MIAPPMHPVGLGFLRQASRPLHLLPRLSDPLTRDADKVHRALQAGSVLRCGVAGQLRQSFSRRACRVSASCFMPTQPA